MVVLLLTLSLLVIRLVPQCCLDIVWLALSLIPNIVQHLTYSEGIVMCDYYIINIAKTPYKISISPSISISHLLLLMISLVEGVFDLIGFLLGLFHQFRDSTLAIKDSIRGWIQLACSFSLLSFFPPIAIYNLRNVDFLDCFFPPFLINEVFMFIINFLNYFFPLLQWHELFFDKTLVIYIPLYLLWSWLIDFHFRLWFFWLLIVEIFKFVVFGVHL